MVLSCASLILLHVLNLQMNIQFKRKTFIELPSLLSMESAAQFCFLPKTTDKKVSRLAS